MNNLANDGGRTPASFSGHDSFALRHLWLEKAFHEVESTQGHENPFSSEDSIVRFGVGKNMVNAIKHWALASSFIIKDEKGFRASEYASSIMHELDPYFEKASTLWKIHYEIAKNPTNTTIYWIFSRNNSASFSRDYLERKLVEYCRTNAFAIPATKTLRTDTSVSLAMYCGGRNDEKLSEDEISCPLQELGLIRLNHDGTYSVAIGPKKSLRDSLIISAIHEYWSVTDPHSTSINLEKLLYSPQSPGRIFALSETDLLDRIARISESTNGMLEVSETAGIVQIFKNQRKFKSETLKNLWKFQ